MRKLNVFDARKCTNATNVCLKGESGRSMVEILGVLAIIGVLSVGGIMGYQHAMNRYQANELLFFAKQYAAQIFIGRRTHPNQFGIPSLPTAKELGMNPLEIGVYPTDDYLKDGGIELHLSFYNQTHCVTSANLLNTRCQLVSKGAPCKDVVKSGITPEELAQVVGCFDYVFHDN